MVIKPVLLNISFYNLSQMSCELSIAALYANNEISLTLTRYIELSKNLFKKLSFFYPIVYIIDL